MSGLWRPGLKGADVRAGEAREDAEEWERERRGLGDHSSKCYCLPGVSTAAGPSSPHPAPVPQALAGLKEQMRRRQWLNSDVLGVLRRDTVQNQKGGTWKGSHPAKIKGLC